jgi:hypothetical protein
MTTPTYAWSKHSTGRTGVRVALVCTGVSARALAAAGELASRPFRSTALHARELGFAAHTRDPFPHDDLARLAEAQVAR